MTKRRLGVALVAYACLLGQLSAFAHRALVQHATCSEHGESVHLTAATEASRAALTGSGGSPSAASLPAPGQSEDRTSTRVGAAAIASADEHDHCSVVLSRALAAQSPPASVAAALPLAGALALASQIVAPSGTATYLLAPKTSPPRRCT